MAFVLRRYQEEALETIRNFINPEKPNKGLVRLPTGSGKTLIIGRVIMEHASKFDGILVLTNGLVAKQNLIDQLFKRENQIITDKSFKLNDIIIDDELRRLKYKDIVNNVHYINIMNIQKLSSTTEIRKKVFFNTLRKDKKLLILIDESSGFESNKTETNNKDTWNNIINRMTKIIDNFNLIMFSAHTKNTVDEIYKLEVNDAEYRRYRKTIIKTKPLEFTFKNNENKERLFNKIIEVYTERVKQFIDLGIGVGFNPIIIVYGATRVEYNKKLYQDFVNYLSRVELSPLVKGYLTPKRIVRTDNKYSEKDDILFNTYLDKPSLLRPSVVFLINKFTAAWDTPYITDIFIHSGITKSTNQLEQLIGRGLRLIKQNGEYINNIGLYIHTSNEKLLEEIINKYESDTVQSDNTTVKKNKEAVVVKQDIYEQKLKSLRYIPSLAKAYFTVQLAVDENILKTNSILEYNTEFIKSKYDDVSTLNLKRLTNINTLGIIRFNKAPENYFKIILDDIAFIFSKLNEIIPEDNVYFFNIDNPNNKYKETNSNVYLFDKVVGSSADLELYEILKDELNKLENRYEGLVTFVFGKNDHFHKKIKLMYNLNSYYIPDFVIFIKYNNNILLIFAEAKGDHLKNTKNLSKQQIFKHINTIFTKPLSKHGYTYMIKAIEKFYTSKTDQEFVVNSLNTIVNSFLTFVGGSNEE